MSEVKAEDVGKILLDVKDQLSKLRGDVRSASATPDGAVQSLEAVLRQAELDLSAKAENVLRDLSRTVATVQPNATKRLEGGHGGPRHSYSAERLPRRSHAMRLGDPERIRARRTVEERYGLRSPPRPSRPRPIGGRVPPLKRRQGKVAGPNTILPAANRADPTLDPPPVTEKDVQQGLFHLVERGFIPADVDLLPGMATVLTNAACTIHPPVEMRRKQPIHVDPSGGFQSAVRLDLYTEAGPKYVVPPEMLPGSMRPPLISRIPVAEDDDRTSSQKSPSPEPHMGPHPSPRPSTAEVEAAEAARVVDARKYDALMDEYALHHVLIRRGKVLDTTPEFISFARANVDRWGVIGQILHAEERVMRKFAVPLAWIDGKMVERLAARQDLTQLTVEDLMACVLNLDEVAPLIRIPGQRYKGVNGIRAAATKIQATFRMYLCRRQYKEFLRFLNAVLVVQRAWRSRSSIKSMRRVVLKAWQARKEAFSQIMDDFALRWPEIKRRKRVAIHLPSLSYKERQRTSFPEMRTRQNCQIARLCDMEDPDVDVVYVAPFPLDDLTQYYAKLFALHGVANSAERFRVVVPEKADAFVEHLSLTKALLMSPRAMKRLRNLVAGKEAYIIPGVVSLEEMHLAVLLNIPLLGARPDHQDTYATKSGSKRIFQAANVAIPVGKYDVYDEGQFLMGLSELISTHMKVTRWLFKIDDEFNGRGHATFDVRALPCFERLAREYDRFHEGWDSEWQQHQVRKRLLAELPETLARCAIVANKEVYSSWKRYMRAFLKQGGVIEAYPTNIVGTPSATLLIEPDGQVQFVCAHDQLFDGTFQQCGTLFPQQSHDPKVVQKAAKAVGRTCFAKGIYGYVTVDFVSFVDRTGMPALWAVDLNLQLTDSTVAFSLFHFLMQGEFNAEDGTYTVDALDDRTDNKDLVGERFFLSANHLTHEGLCSMPYSVLFGMCRAKGITFAPVERMGTVFVLIDSYTKGTLGILTMARSAADVTTRFENNLKELQREMSDPKGVEAANNFSELLKAVRALGYTKPEKTVPDRFPLR